MAVSSNYTLSTLPKPTPVLIPEKETRLGGANFHSITTMFPTCARKLHSRWEEGLGMARGVRLVSVNGKSLARERVQIEITRSGVKFPSISESAQRFLSFCGARAVYLNLSPARCAVSR